MGIVIFLIVGLIAGLLARALVPGKDSMGILATLLLGIVGSFVGGAIWALFSDDKDPRLPGRRAHPVGRRRRRRAADLQPRLGSTLTQGLISRPCGEWLTRATG